MEVATSSSGMRIAVLSIPNVLEHSPRVGAAVRFVDDDPRRTSRRRFTARRGFP